MGRSPPPPPSWCWCMGGGCPTPTRPPSQPWPQYSPGWTPSSPTSSATTLPSAAAPTPSCRSVWASALLPLPCRGSHFPQQPLAGAGDPSFRAERKSRKPHWWWVGGRPTPPSCGWAGSDPPPPSRVSRAPILVQIFSWRCQHRRYFSL